MKRKTQIRILIILVLFGGVGRYGWLSMYSVTSVQSAKAPDKRHIAKVSSKWRDTFWTGAAHEYHFVTVESADGRVIRKVITDEPWTGWPKDCSMQWATDSLSVAFTFKVEEALKTRLVLDVRQ